MDPVVILGSDSVSAGPGQEHRLPVRIRNQGRRVESYRVDVIGATAAFAQVVPNTVSVLPGREAEIDVIFRPPGGATTPTGAIPFAIRATSEVDASSSAVAEGRLELAGVAGLQAWAPETSRKGRWSARYHVEFANQGNAAVRLALTAHDPAGAMRLKLTPDVVDLPPGGQASAKLECKARQPFLRGSPVNRNLQVACQTFPFGSERPLPGSPPPEGDPNHRTFQLAFEQRPVLPKFAIPLLVLAVAALVAFAVVRLRGGEEPPLGFTNPLPPEGLQATPAGPAAILLQWEAVPNAENYEIRRVSIAGVASPEVLEPALPPDQKMYQVDGLEPGTEYCFAVRALGAEERASLPTDERCERTGVPTQLPPPTDVAVTSTGGETYSVTWALAEGLGDDVLFEIILDGVLTGKVGPRPPLTIDIPAGVDARSASIAVQAVRSAERSAPSAEVTVTVDAKPVVIESTVTPTTAVPETTVAPATTVDGGATTTATVPSTSASTSTSTPPATTAPPVVSELKNVELTWVAMLGQVTPTSGGGLTLEERKQRLAEAFSVELEQIEVFTNRDTVALEIDRSPSILATASAAQRYAYVETDDPDAAAAICGRGIGCLVLQLVGAARSAEGTEILILERLPAGASSAEVDREIDAARSKLRRQSVHVVSGPLYPSLATSGPVVFVRGFASAGEVTNFCTEASISPCNHQTLQPAG